MSDRGMKTWARFSSLIEQSTILEEMFYEKNKKVKPSISNERANKINQILVNYHGRPLKIKYYYDGYIYEIVCQIKRVDTLNRKLILDDGEIPFSELIDLSIDYNF